ncbi:MAG: IPT/TIG domain-containing protein, partial [Calditrichia bacterium]|nr:IPT/TIG domain-containing protein [Calditrichia bacterium]
DLADITVVSESLIKTCVPNTLGNGHHDIDLIVDGNSANKRKFEVMPLIQSFTPSQGRAGDSININGQRLDGTQIRISIGPAVIIAAATANPNQISFDVPKTLSLGEYKVKITVDGHESNIETFEVVE